MVVRDRDVFGGAFTRDVPMRLLLLGLTFFCVVALAAIESPPPPPPAGLTTRQVGVWNDWTRAEGFKNIWIIQIDKSILLSNGITVDVNGKSYRFDGKSTRLKPFLVVDEQGHRMVEGVSWSGQSEQGSGTMTQTDDGEFGGSFTLENVKVYNIIGADNVTFLVELDQTPPRKAEAPPSVALAPQSRVERACSAANQGTQSPRSAVFFGPGTEAQLSPPQAAYLPELRAAKIIKKAYPLYGNRRAVDSNEILVDIDGKRYRFVGTNQCLDAPPWDSWTGQTSSGDRAEISRTLESMLATFRIGDRTLVFAANDSEYGILYERNPDPPVANSPAPSIRRTPPAEVEAGREARRSKEKLIKEAQKLPTTQEEKCAALERSAQMVELRLRLPQSKYAKIFLDNWQAATRSNQLELGC